MITQVSPRERIEALSDLWNASRTVAEFSGDVLLVRAARDCVGLCATAVEYVTRGSAMADEVCRLCAHAAERMIEACEDPLASESFGMVAAARRWVESCQSGAFVV